MAKDYNKIFFLVYNSLIESGVDPDEAEVVASDEVEEMEAMDKLEDQLNLDRI